MNSDKKKKCAYCREGVPMVTKQKKISVNRLE